MPFENVLLECRAPVVIMTLTVREEALAGTRALPEKRPLEWKGR
jgi:hypothetical protein